ncbi:TPA: radical SAM protein [bacterium]|nr:radical SAM protein [bacterium]
MKKCNCGSYYELPTLCHIETTYLCNQNCIFCYNPRRAEKVNYEKLDAIVDSVARAKVPHVYISGGEPSMLKLDKLNGYIEKLSLNSSVTVLTNGFITMKGLNKKIACLGVPIHGSNATEHESMTGLKGSFEKMKESVRYYVSRKQTSQRTQR